jgi:hypothetical protein
MTYLDENLPCRKEQIVSCHELYTLILRVRHRPRKEAITARETDNSIAQIITSVVPQVEDWQFRGRRNGFVEFGFHILHQRFRAQEELTFRGYHTEICCYSEHQKKPKRKPCQ